jgi:hypothetical protein
MLGQGLTVTEGVQVFSFEDQRTEFGITSDKGQLDGDGFPRQLAAIKAYVKVPVGMIAVNWRLP